MAPIIYRGPSDTGIQHTGNGIDPARFGLLGDIDAATFHHSAGPRAGSRAAACRLHQAFQRDHMAQGWGDIGYHASVDDFGRVYLLRPITFKGAHTGGHNTGNIGIMFHGNYDHDRLTDAQKDTLKWLFQGGFNRLFGVRESDILLARGHQEWPGPTNQTACPGRDIMRSLVYRRNRDLNPS